MPLLSVFFFASEEKKQLSAEKKEKEAKLENDVM